MGARLRVESGCVLDDSKRDKFLGYVTQWGVVSGEEDAEAPALDLNIISPIVGITQLEPANAGRRIVYYGGVLRIPFSVRATLAHDELDVEFFRSLFVTEDGSLRDEATLIRLGGVIEWYEVYEVGSRDLLVMVRIPCLVKNPQSDTTELGAVG